MANKNIELEKNHTNCEIKIIIKIIILLKITSNQLQFSNLKRIKQRINFEEEKKSIMVKTRAMVKKELAEEDARLVNALCATWRNHSLIPDISV